MLAIVGGFLLAIYIFYLIGAALSSLGDVIEQHEDHWNKTLDRWISGE